jgi:hypothetical protein
MWSSLSARIIRLVLAPILSLWVAGAGCMLGCESMIAAAATSVLVNSSDQAGHHRTIVVSGDACAASKSHDCCKKNATQVVPEAAGPHAQPSTTGVTLVSWSGASSEAMKECPLAVSRTVVTPKKGAGEANASPTVAHSIIPPLSFIEQTLPLSSALRLSNRGHTYLRCCAFLI